MRQLALLMFIVVVSGCGQRPPGARCPCPNSYDFVCGRNGRTYQNVCLLDCDGVDMDRRGACAPGNCNCPGDTAFVCGKDGRTYQNECKLRCAGVELARNSSCDPNACSCAEDYTPVCSKGGVTFQNQCKLDCVGADFGNLGVWRQR